MPSEKYWLFFLLAAGFVTDFDFSPFDDSLLATGAEDGIVSLVPAHSTSPLAVQVFLLKLSLYT